MQILTQSGMYSYPEKIVTCVPVAELTETIDENHLKAKVTIKIRPVTAKFIVDIKIEKREIPDFELAMTGNDSDISGKGGASKHVAQAECA